MTDAAPSSSTSTATQLTPGGRGAVTTIRCTGDIRPIDAADPRLFRAANGRPLAEQPLGRIVFGQWGIGPVEEIVVCRIAEHELELHCHGGDAAVRRILGDLRAAGCRIIPWHEALARTEGTLAAEYAEALAAATTLRTAEILLEQQSGVLRRALQELLADEPLESLLPAVDTLLRWSEFGRHLTHPWSVVLAGRPNVGKSSLINALLGYARSIVYDQPGTTRDVVTARTALQGWPIEFADTAGIRDRADELESAGIDRARQRLAAADLIVLLLDTSRPPDEDDWRLLREQPEAVVVAHKADLPNAWNDRIPPRALRASSVTGEGVEVLAAAIVSRLVPEVPAPGTPVPFTPRQTALLQRGRAALARNDLGEFRRAVQACVG